MPYTPLPLGMYVHLKWRTITPAEAEGWLLESGLENAHCLSFDGRTFCRQLSVACVGSKPVREIDARVAP